MKRASILNDDHCGFHARSCLLSAEAARSVIEKFSLAKGYTDPVLDIQGGILVLEKPVEAKNLRSSRCRVGEYPVPWGATEEISPCRFWAEAWPWAKIAPIIEGDGINRWKAYQTFDWETKMVAQDHKIKYSWSIVIYPKESEADSLRIVFRSNNLRHNHNCPVLEEKIGSVISKILDTIGLSHCISVRGGETLESSLIFDIMANAEPFLHDQVYLEFSDKVTDEPFTVPRGIAESLNSHRQIILPNVPPALAVRLVQEILNILEHPTNCPSSLKFSPEDAQIPAFREWAEPRFGSPWLQNILGWAIKTPSAKDIDDSLPDWVLLPVAHFKILGSWRIVTVVKEPGGWRFHVTGKYTKDPLKHRHIRDELARKAGMTSETFWEPQEAGEGWLGVPG